MYIVTIIVKGSEGCKAHQSSNRLGGRLAVLLERPGVPGVVTLIVLLVSDTNELGIESLVLESSSKTSSIGEGALVVF